MNLLLQRIEGRKTSTVGKLYADGIFLCWVLEDVVREVRGVPVENWKQFGKTAIPSTDYVGKPYVVTLEHSNRFGAETPTINAVPGFTGVRMHAGNTDADTEGCLLLGAAIDENGIRPGTSRTAVGLVRQLLQQAVAQQELVTLQINNIVEVA